MRVSSRSTLKRAADEGLPPVRVITLADISSASIIPDRLDPSIRPRTPSASRRLKRGCGFLQHSEKRSSFSPAAAAYDYSPWPPQGPRLTQAGVTDPRSHLDPHPRRLQLSQSRRCPEISPVDLHLPDTKWAAPAHRQVSDLEEGDRVILVDAYDVDK